MKLPLSIVSLLGVASYVLATKSDIAWRAVVDTTTVEFSTDGIGNDQTGLYISATVDIQRLSSSADTVTIVGTLQSNGNTTDDVALGEPQTVFTEMVPVTGDSARHTVFFDLVIPAVWDNQLLSITVVTDSGASAETDGLIITYDPNTDTFTPKTPGEFQHEENVRINEELEVEEGTSREILQNHPEDLGQEPDLPGDVLAGIDPGTPKDEQGTGPVDPVDPPTCSYGVSCPTPSPKPTPTPKPTCPKRRSLNDRRQTTITTATVNAKLTFAGWNGQRQDLRIMRVTAWGNIYDADSKFVERVFAVRNTSSTGTAQFVFPLATDQTMKVDRLVTRLEGDKYVIGTKLKKDGALTRSTVTLNLINNPWQLRGGDVKSYTNHHPQSPVFDRIIVADIFQRVIDYTRTQVVTSPNIDKLEVWFPSLDSGTYLSETYRFINIPSDDARDPDVIAHEYGHWLHMLARRGGDLDAGGPHKGCTSPNDKVALSEGFATAFGLLAVDNTILWHGVYGQYDDLRPDGTVGLRRNYETYSCKARSLNNDEGRITAAIWDMGDRRLDTPPADSDDTAQIYDGFTVNDTNVFIRPHFLFWRAINSNPQNFREYWASLRAIISTDGERRAWNVLRYNWVDFARS